MTPAHHSGRPLSLPARIFALLTMLAVMLVPPLHLVAAHGHLDLSSGRTPTAGLADGSTSQSDTLCTLCNTFNSALHSVAPLFTAFQTVVDGVPQLRAVRIGTNCPLDRFCRPPPAAALAATAGAA